MWLLLVACQAPFGTDRHDLVGFRVAALAVTPADAGETVAPELALVVDGRPWADSPVELLWYWVADPDAVLEIDPLTPIDGFGPAPSLTVPEDRRTLALVATHRDQERRAYVEVATPPASLPRDFAVEVAGIPLRVGAVEGPELLLDARADLAPQPLDDVEPGDFLRFSTALDGDPLVRWMATDGTFFELDRQVTDWAAGDVRLDEDQIEDGWTLLDPGPVTFIALALGTPGEVRFSAFDVVIGPRGEGVVVGGRVVPTDIPLAPGPGQLVVGTVTLDDASPTGIALTGARLEAAGSVAYGSATLPCSVELAGPFDPNWLLDTRCVRSAIEGYEVAVAPERAW